jgi:hypothetical protein
MQALFSDLRVKTPTVNGRGSRTLPQTAGRFSRTDATHIPYKGADALTIQFRTRSAPASADGMYGLGRCVGRTAKLLTVVLVRRVAKRQNRAMPTLQLYPFRFRDPLTGKSYHAANVGAGPRCISAPGPPSPRTA